MSGEPEGVAHHPTLEVVYITCEEEGDIYVLRPSDGAVETHFRLGGRPRTVLFTPDGKQAYIPLETQASVAVIDAQRHQPVDTIALPEPSLPMDAALPLDGRELYVSTGRGARVAVIDLATKRVVSQIPVGTRPWGIALSPDGRWLFTANGPSNDVSVVDVQQRREVTRIKTGAGPWGVAIGPALGTNEQNRADTTALQPAQPAAEK